MTRRLAPRPMMLAAGMALALSPIAIAQTTPADQKADAPKVASVAKPAAQSRIDKYAKVLNLDKDQAETAKDLYDAFQKQSAAASKKLRESMQTAQDDMNDGNHAGFEKQTAKTLNAHAEDTKRLTDTFLSDLKALLRPDQTDRWPAFERFRRREKYLTPMMSFGGMGVGGSSVDLTTLIDKVAIPADRKGRVAEQLAMYEQDIDRPLRDREQNTTDEQKQMGAVQTFDHESFTKKLERDRKVDLAIRDVNLKYLRQITPLLPDDVAKKLNDTYQLRAFRTIYKDSNVSKKLAAAGKLPDLTADQKSRLAALADSYKKDARTANDRWAAAQQKAETEGRSSGGPGILIMGPGDSGGTKTDPDLADARSARRSIDDAARQKLESILTPDQLAAATPPAPDMSGPGVHKMVMAFGDGTGEDMVFTDDIDLGDDIGSVPEGGIMIMRTVEVHTGGGGADQAKPAEKKPKPD